MQFRGAHVSCLSGLKCFANSGLVHGKARLHSRDNNLEYQHLIHIVLVLPSHLLDSGLITFLPNPQSLLQATWLLERLPSELLQRRVLRKGWRWRMSSIPLTHWLLR